MSSLSFPGLDSDTRQKLELIASHYDIDIYKLVQSTCSVVLNADGYAQYTPIPEFIDFFAQEHPFTPTRRRLILHYASQLPASVNPFTIGDLMNALPSDAEKSWYNRKTVGHALGYARTDEEEWFETVRETFGKEERWFVGRRAVPYAPLRMDQLERLYILRGADILRIGDAVHANLINITYSVTRVMLDCMTQQKMLDGDAVRKHIHYFQEGYDKPTRIQAILIDFIGEMKLDDFSYTEVIRKKLAEDGCGHPAVWMTQESLGHFLKRTWQTQESRQGRLSDTYKLERQRGSNTWLWRAIPYDRTTDHRTEARP